MEVPIVAYNEPQPPNISSSFPTNLLSSAYFFHLNQKPRKLKNFSAIFQKPQHSKIFFREILHKIFPEST